MTDNNASSEAAVRKLQTMLNIQNELNQEVNKDWPNAGYKWRDAVMIEAAELFDHLNWKWWKAYSQDPDWGQVRMEAVDIWHFIMSEIIEAKKSIDTVELANRLVNLKGKTENAISHNVAMFVRELMFISSSTDKMRDQLVPFSLNIGDINSLVTTFLKLLDSLGMDFDALFKMYVGKATLNRLRWRHGYGKGYIKDWLGEEDNKYLDRCLSELDANDPEFVSKLSKMLEERYHEVCVCTPKRKEESDEAYRERTWELM